MTNLEAIQHFDKYDMAEWISNYMDCDVCPAYEMCHPGERCYDTMKDWLLSKYDESKNILDLQSKRKIWLEGKI